MQRWATWGQLYLWSMGLLEICLFLTRGRGAPSFLPQRRSVSAGLLSRIIPGIKHLFFAARIARRGVGSTAGARSDLQPAAGASRGCFWGNPIFATNQQSTRGLVSHPVHCSRYPRRDVKTFLG